MPWIAAAGAGLGAIGGYFAAQSQAEAQQRAGELQASANVRDRATLMKLALGTDDFSALGGKSLLASSGPSVDELSALSEQLDAIHQTLKLRDLQFNESMFDPYTADRLKQRNQLEATLREQMGSGYATSTAGQQALQQFDQGSAMQRADQRLQLGQFQLQANQQALGGYAQRLGNLGGIQQRQADTFRTLIGALAGTPTAPYAGASEIGNIGRAQALGNLFQGVGSAGLSYGMQQQQQDYNRETLKQLFGKPIGTGGP